MGGGGGGTKREGGGEMLSFTPAKRGANKALAMLKEGVGHTQFWGRFYAVA